MNLGRFSYVVMTYYFRGLFNPIHSRNNILLRDMLSQVVHVEILQIIFAYAYAASFESALINAIEVVRLFKRICLRNSQSFHHCICLGKLRNVIEF